MKKKLTLTTFTLITSALIAGCGGGSSATDTTSTTGTVIDGYLKDAMVCIDKNENGKCDADEPKAYTDENGKYVIPASAENYPIVAEVIANKTFDVTYNTPITQNATLISLPDAPDTISPYTTLAYGLCKKFGFDTNEAKEKIKELFGINPEENYIASNNATVAVKALLLTLSGTLSADNIENVAAAFLLNPALVESINTTAESFSVNLDNIKDLIDEIEDNATKVSQEIEDCSKEAEFIVDNITKYENNLDLDNLKELIDEGSADVITPNGLYRNCQIRGEEIPSGIDMTINCSAFEIYGTNPPIYSTENMFVAKVENATDTTLENNYVVVTKTYNGTLAYSSDDLNGTYANIRYDADTWKPGDTTYIFTPDTTNSSNGTLEVRSSTTLIFSYYRDDNGTIVAENETNGDTVYLYPLLRDLNKDGLFYMSGEVSGNPIQEAQILIKQ